MHRSLPCTHQHARRQLSHARVALPTDKLLDTLRRNPEIDAFDAENELRWIQQSLPVRNEKTLSFLVERRAKGEPLQYILGGSDTT